MKTFITQILVISSLSLSMAYAHDHGGGGRPPMSGEMKEAFDACHEEVEMPERKSGERPTKEQHEAMKTCLKSKGITPKGRGGPPPEENEE